MVFSYLYVTDTRASIHTWLVPRLIRVLYPDAEDAHEAGTRALRILYSAGLNPRERNSRESNSGLAVTVFDQELQNPIGTSAGIDKNGEVPDALLAFGGAVVEIGGTTPFPQDGNPKPRVFRIPSQRGLINRYGLNSLGAEELAMRLRERVRMWAYHNGFGLGPEAEEYVLSGQAEVPVGGLEKGKMLLVQIAKMKETPEGDIEKVKRDYVFCVEQLARYADVLVVNVSSPNTPGLRDLQAVGPLTELLTGVVDAADKFKGIRKQRPRVMVKVSPDEDEDTQVQGIVEAVWRSGVDGVIVGNTTRRRTGLTIDGHTLPAIEANTMHEQGGYSGPQMFQRTLGLVKKYRSLLDRGPAIETEDESPSAPKHSEAQAIATPDDPASSVPAKIDSAASSIGSAVVESVKEAVTAAKDTVIGNPERKVIFATGGITNGAQALEILNAGASVAMVYTALVYGGVGTVSRMKREMRDEIGKK